MAAKSAKPKKSRQKVSAVTTVAPVISQVEREQKLLQEAQARLLQRRVEQHPLQLSVDESVWPQSPFLEGINGAVLRDWVVRVLGLLVAQPRVSLRELAAPLLEQVQCSDAGRVAVNNWGWAALRDYALMVSELQWPQKPGWFMVVLRRGALQILPAGMTPEGLVVVVGEQAPQYDFNDQGEVRGTLRGQVWQPFLLRVVRGRRGGLIYQ